LAPEFWRGPKRVDAFRGRESFPKLRAFVARVAFRDARLTSRTRQIMHIPSEYGWTLIAIGGACAATIFGSIKVRLPSDPTACDVRAFSTAADLIARKSATSRALDPTVPSDT
jgi:hypothetical protein